MSIGRKVVAPKRNSFGLAFPKREGGKLFPPDYFYMNGVLPKRDFYTKEELEEHKKFGIEEDWYD